MLFTFTETLPALKAAIPPHFLRAAIHAYACLTATAKRTHYSFFLTAEASTYASPRI